MMDAVSHALGLPTVQVAVERPPRQEVTRQQPLRMAGPQRRQDGIDQLPRIGTARKASMECVRYQLGDGRQLAIGQVRRVASAASLHPASSTRADTLCNALQPAPESHFSNRL
jgi:hypothetical protein